MKRYTLEAREDFNTGELGLVLLGVRHDEELNAATEGELLAHDIVEHQNGPAEIGSIADELQALGAIWLTRGQHGDLSRRGYGSAYSPEQNIASEIARMGALYLSGAEFPARVPRTRAHEHDASFRHIVALGLRGVRDEIGEPLSREERRDLVQHYGRAALAFMRIGARKLARRYRGRGRFAPNNDFWAIAEAVAPYCARPEFEGMRYCLTVGRGEAWCEPLYDEEDYY